MAKGWWARLRYACGWTTRAEDIEALAAAFASHGGHRYRFGAADEVLAERAAPRNARLAAAVRRRDAARGSPVRDEGDGEDT